MDNRMVPEESKSDDDHEEKEKFGLVADEHRFRH